MKSALSSYELRHVVAELQCLVGAKIEKIFQQEKPRDDFLFSLHVPSKGRTYMYVSLPKVLCLSSFKPSFPQMPPAFCTSLRRKITNAKIMSINQFEFQRIVMIELSSKMGTSTLVIELFSTGNMILLNQENTIIATLHSKIWNENRKILHNQVYQFPKQEYNPLALSQEEFDRLLSSSQKDSLVTCLAIDCGLGGTYAEYLLSQTDEDKSVAPKNAKDSKKLFVQLQQLLNHSTQPVKTASESFPIPIIDGESIPSFNEAIAHMLLEKLEQEEQKELTKNRTKSLTKFDKVIVSQTKQRDGLIASAKLNQETGELIYQHYQEIDQVLKKIALLKKSTSWEDIQEELKKYPYVVSLDKHTGKLQVEFS